MPRLELTTVSYGSLCDEDCRTLELSLDTQQHWSVGRCDASDVRLYGNSTSRKHARIFREPDGRWYVQDLGSAHGTYVNGERLESKATIQWTSNVLVTFGCPRNLQGKVNEKDRRKTSCDEVVLYMDDVDLMLEVLLAEAGASNVQDAGIQCPGTTSSALASPTTPCFVVPLGLEVGQTLVEDAEISKKVSSQHLSIDGYSAKPPGTTSPGTKMPPGAIAKVRIDGMPKSLVSKPMFEAVLAESDTYPIDFSVSMDNLGYGMATAYFSDLATAESCASHFDGCCWDRGPMSRPVTAAASLVQPSLVSSLPEPVFIPVPKGYRASQTKFGSDTPSTHLGDSGNDSGPSGDDEVGNGVSENRVHRFSF